jgi:hypothetical protein
MRVTLDLDDRLFARVKLLAAESDQTVDSVVEEALKSLLVERSQLRRRVQLPQSIETGWVRSGVDINDSSAVRELLDS